MQVYLGVKFCWCAVGLVPGFRGNRQAEELQKASISVDVWWRAMKSQQLVHGALEKQNKTLTHHGRTTRPELTINLPLSTRSFGKEWSHDRRSVSAAVARHAEDPKLPHHSPSAGDLRHFKHILTRVATGQNRTNANNTTLSLGVLCSWSLPTANTTWLSTIGPFFLDDEGAECRLTPQPLLYGAACHPHSTSARTQDFNSGQHLKLLSLHRGIHDFR